MAMDPAQHSSSCRKPLHAAALLEQKGDRDGAQRLRSRAERSEQIAVRAGETLSPYPTYLLGLLADAQHKAAQAMASYRKPLHAAALLEQKGDRDGAQRLRSRAERSERVQVRGAEGSGRD